MGRSRSWPNGSTRAYRRARRRVLERDGWLCRLRGPGCRGRADTAHHTRDRLVWGDDPAWMVAACAPCNIRAGDPIGASDPAPVQRTRW